LVVFGVLILLIVKADRRGRFPAMKGKKL
jgi:hypothetical protein